MLTSLIQTVNAAFNWLPWLGLGGAGLLGIFGYVLGLPQLLTILSSLLTIITPILTGMTQGAVWFLKQFLIGVGVIFQNLSVLAVIIVLLTASSVSVYEKQQSVVDQCTARLDLTAKQLVQERAKKNVTRSLW